MLQIIGWLGCAYLLLRSVQMGFSRDMQDENGKMRDGATYTMIIGIVAAAGFAFWLGAQGGQFETQPDLADLRAEADRAERVTECMERASPDYAAMMACQ
ncbi:MAG: hypothetical protein Unbinned273contig1001_59 [Prokaryotic dsDNA virus sp.]|nr:MAG: hypothetical protein Unbinned273contig1001_59 [Prokaryotic dsDNA virus sp.]|tara:strand:- start:164 stop:463 length:300 start_codon:yes stop_codon:yes gene_type:complete